MEAKHRIAAQVLAAGGNKTDAANAVGVKPRQIRRWMHDVPGFAEASLPVQAKKEPERDDVALSPVDAIRQLAHTAQSEPTRLAALRYLDERERVGPAPDPNKVLKIMMFGPCRECSCPRCRNFWSYVDSAPDVDSSATDEELLARTWPDLDDPEYAASH